MADEMRAMLDQLMGKDRDLPPEQRKGKVIHFDHPEVCHYALVGLCPYQLFSNTRSDLGPCPNGEIHEDHLDWEGIAAEWNKLDERQKQRYGYERELLKLLQRLVAECDRKIEKAKERAALDCRPKPLTPQQQQELDAIKAEIKGLTERSEKAAEMGDVDASLAAVTQAEKLQKDHDRLHKKMTEPDKYTTVCEVCGVFIQSTDNEARRQDHLTGKQYLGWLAIRQKCKDLEEAERQRAAGPREEGELPSGSGHRERSRSRDRERRGSSRDDRSGGYERGSDRGYDRDRRRGIDDRERDGSRRREREHSYDYRRGDDRRRERDYEKRDDRRRY